MYYNFDEIALVAMDTIVDVIKDASVNEVGNDETLYTLCGIAELYNALVVKKQENEE